MLGGLSFKSTFSNGRGVWVRVREINYLIQKGIIYVDMEALKNFTDNNDEEFNALIRDDTLEAGLKDLIGRELDDMDRKLIEDAQRVVSREHDSMLESSKHWKLRLFFEQIFDGTSETLVPDPNVVNRPST